MGSLSRKQWPDFMRHAVAALNMGWSLEDSKPNCGSAHISSSGENEEMKTVPHTEFEWLSDEDGDFDPPQKPLHSTPLTSKQFHRRQRNFLQNSRATLLACVPKTRWTISLQIILVTQVLLCAAFEAQIGREIISYSARSRWYNHITKMVAIQLATLVFESCYQFILGLNATRMCNIVTNIGICINNISMLVLAILSAVGVDQELQVMSYWVPYRATAPNMSDLSDEDRRELEELTLINPGTFRKGFGGLVGTLELCTLALSFVTYKLYGQFAWDIYRHIATADRPMRRRYLMYEIYISLLHLDFFFLLGFWLQTLAEGGKGTLWYGTPMLCIAPFQFLFAGRLVRREKRWGSIITSLLIVVQMAAISLRVATLEVIEEDPDLVSEDSAITRTLAYACLVLLSLMATFVMIIVSTRNFGKGLQPYLKRNQVIAEQPAGIDTQKRANYLGEGFEYQELSRPVPARMELD